MSVKDRTLSRLEKQMRESFARQGQGKNRVIQLFYRVKRFALMLYHEIVNDDVGIRAQSFSYLTLFSILPILAGLFILFGFMSQWGPIEKGFEDFLAQILEPIPDDYRDTLLEFVLSFKEQYVAKMQEKSASIGILALGVLVWVTAKVFFNIEDLMNRVWSARANRTWLERVQNFILSSVLFPIVAAVSFSLPSILERFGSHGVRVGAFFGDVLPFTLFALMLSMMFRYFPNVKVTWKSALSGALFSTVLFAASNILLKIYFKFGTDTAYGKIAVLPIVAFFIYVMWFIFILGAEVSYLVQNHNQFIGKKMPSATLAEAILVIDTLELFDERFKRGARPLTAGSVAAHFNVSVNSVQKVIRFLNKHGILIESAPSPKLHESAFILARDLKGVDQVMLLQEYLHVSELIQTFDARPIFKEVLAEFVQNR